MSEKNIMDFLWRTAKDMLMLGIAIFVVIMLTQFMPYIAAKISLHRDPREVGKFILAAMVVIASSLLVVHYGLERANIRLSDVIKKIFRE